MLIENPGGFGKTSFLAQTSILFLQQQIPVYWLELKKITQGFNVDGKLSFPKLFNQTTIIHSYDHFRKQLQSKNELVLIIDGINEIYENILLALSDMVDGLCRKYKGLRVFLSIRQIPNGFSKELKVSNYATIDLLKSTEVDEFLNHKFIKSSSRNQILRIPFFLDIYMQLSTPVEMKKGRTLLFRKYFSVFVGLTLVETENLSRICYFSYEKNKSINISKDYFHGEYNEILDKLSKAGIIDTMEDIDSSVVRFKHQLYHDYLVGVYIAKEGQRCNHEIFDHCTFRAKNIEPLSFAIELIDEKDAESFLIAIYDWNYRSISECLAQLKVFNYDLKLSNDMAFVLQVKNAEKLLDIFEETISSAYINFKQLNYNIGIALDKLKDFKEIDKCIETYNPSASLFKEWKALYLIISNDQINHKSWNLYKSNPIISWTFSNIIKRISLSYVQQMELRALFYFSEDASVQWKIVHSIGAYDSKENVTLLVEALKGSENVWVKYGAIRSLLEIAYNSIQLRNEIFAWLHDNMNVLTNEIVINEIRKSLLIRNANKEWYCKAIEFAQGIYDNYSFSHVEKDLWEILLKEIKNRINL